RVILDSMVWRHLSAAIDDPRPTAGSFSMDDVRCLSAHVIKLRDIPERVLVLSRHNREALSWYDLLGTCHSKNSGPLSGLYLCRIVLRYRCIRTELITPNLICPSTYQLLRSSGGDSGPDPSFDKTDSLERSFSFSPCCFGRKLSFLFSAAAYFALDFSPS
ncbi:retrovirus-related pol polyprotein from transposon TNT 1-94, partial [Tanacetum coccineum]